MSDDLTIPPQLLRKNWKTWPVLPVLTVTVTRVSMPSKSNGAAGDVRVPRVRSRVPLTPHDLEVIAELTGTRDAVAKASSSNRIGKMKAKIDAKLMWRKGMEWDATRNCWRDPTKRPRGINATRRAQPLGRKPAPVVLSRRKRKK
jgi:hypothetical protein